jgi:acetylornithine deacetylase/succinyl-diaminopimelate desuccinylase-like protein
VRKLREERKVLGDVSFIIEGEEERGSPGLLECVQQNKEFLGIVDAIVMR